MYLFIGLGWMLYFFVHSLLAATSTKQWFYKVVPCSKKYYRIIYNLIAISGLIILFQFTFKDNHLIIESNQYLRGISIISALCGLSILAAAFKVFDKKEFFGFKEISENQVQQKLILAGIYKHIRHPLYSATFFLLIALVLWMPSVANTLFLVISILYIEIGSRLEEKKLIEIFGNDYILYSRKVKRYFPLIY